MGKGKITQFLDLLNRKFEQAYYPETEVSVDESGVRFKGRTRSSLLLRLQSYGAHVGKIQGQLVSIQVAL